MNLISKIAHQIESRDPMLNLLIFKEDLLKRIVYDNSIYCSELEVRILCYLLQEVKGNYVEIGVNKGFTIANICRNNQDRICYGVDMTNETTMHDLQKPEQPSVNEVAHKCRNFENFRLRLGNSRTIDFDNNIGMVFIDGDHTYEGVKADTENVMRQVEPGTLIVWHDYTNNVHPEYMGVQKYLEELKNEHEIVHIKGTWLALCIKK